jgi:hypothetical protein
MVQRPQLLVTTGTLLTEMDVAELAPLRMDTLEMEHLLLSVRNEETELKKEQKREMMGILTMVTVEVALAR